VTPASRFGDVRVHHRQRLAFGLEPATCLRPCPASDHRHPAADGFKLLGHEDHKRLRRLFQQQRLMTVLGFRRRGHRVGLPPKRPASNCRLDRARKSFDRYAVRVCRMRETGRSSGGQSQAEKTAHFICCSPIDKRRQASVRTGDPPNYRSKQRNRDAECRLRIFPAVGFAAFCSIRVFMVAFFWVHGLNRR
jgi:hypothetical protein